MADEKYEMRAGASDHEKLTGDEPRASSKVRRFFVHIFQENFQIFIQFYLDPTPPPHPYSTPIAPYERLLVEVCWLGVPGEVHPPAALVQLWHLCRVFGNSFAPAPFAFGPWCSCLMLFFYSSFPVGLLLFAVTPSSAGA